MLLKWTCDMTQQAMILFSEAWCFYISRLVYCFDQNQKAKYLSYLDYSVYKLKLFSIILDGTLFTYIKHCIAW